MRSGPAIFLGVFVSTGLALAWPLTHLAQAPHRVTAHTAPAANSAPPQQIIYVTVPTPAGTAAPEATQAPTPEPTPATVTVPPGTSGWAVLCSCPQPSPGS